MEQILDIFQHTYAIRALLASVLVGIVCGVLGCFIMLRNMALIGDALSHAILPGVVVGFMIAGHSILAFFTGSVIAGLITAVLITWLQRNVRIKDDAAIGIVFTAMFAAGVMGISYLTRQQGVHLDLKDFLFGNILGIANQDILLTLLITIFVISSIILFYRYFLITTFQQVVAQTMGIPVGVIHYFLMALLSFTVVASLQSVGVILVVAMLIIPASTAYLLTNRLNLMLFLAALAGVVSAVLGLVIAIVFETTPGPAMTVVAFFIYLFAVFFSPNRGFVLKYVRNRKKKSRILREDALKQMVRLHEEGNLNRGNLAEKLNISEIRTASIINDLKKKGLVKEAGNEPELSCEGTKQAYKLIRAHRLWETYLSKELHLDMDNLHQQAEDYEHLLPDPILDELEQRLGYPVTDPHGSVIPQKHGVKSTRLIDMKVGQKAIVTTDQPHEQVAVQLWQYGITPNTPFLFEGEENNELKLKLQDKMVKLPLHLAELVKIAVI